MCLQTLHHDKPQHAIYDALSVIAIENVPTVSNKQVPATRQ